MVETVLAVTKKDLRTPRQLAQELPASISTYYRWLAQGYDESPIETYIDTMYRHKVLDYDQQQRVYKVGKRGEQILLAYLEGDKRKLEESLLLAMLTWGF